MNDWLHRHEWLLWLLVGFNLAETYYVGRNLARLWETVHQIRDMLWNAGHRPDD